MEMFNKKELDKRIGPLKKSKNLKTCACVWYEKVKRKKIQK